MLATGADLIRTSTQIQERGERLKLAEAVAPVAAPAQSHTQLDQDTQSALLRFAHFVRDEEKKKSRPAATVKLKASASQAADRNPYRDQMERERHHDELGQMLNIYV
jgi:hypothetical protein